MGGCFSKCGGKYMVGSKEKDATKSGHGDTPQLVNKLDKNASFSNGNAANGHGQTPHQRRGSAASSSSSSSSSSQGSDQPDPQAVKLLDPESSEPHVVTTSSMQSSSQVTSKNETVTSEDGTHTTTINQEHSQTHVTSATQQVITSTQVITDPKEVEALLAAGGEYTSTHQESSRVCLESSQVTSETRVISGQELEDRIKDIQAGSAAPAPKSDSSSSSSSEDEREKEPADTLVSETTTTEEVGPDTYRTETVEVKTTPDSHTEIVKTVIMTQEHSESHDVEHGHDEAQSEDDIPPPPPPPEAEVSPPKKADLAALGVVNMKGDSSSSSSSSSDEEEIPPPPEEPPQGEQYAQLVTPSGFSPSHEFSPVAQEDEDRDLPTPPPESEVTIAVVDVDEAEVEANAEDGHTNDQTSSSSSHSDSN